MLPPPVDGFPTPCLFTTDPSDRTFLSEQTAPPSDRRTHLAQPPDERKRPPDPAEIQNAEALTAKVERIRLMAFGPSIALPRVLRTASCAGDPTWPIVAGFGRQHAGRARRFLHIGFACALLDDLLPI